MHDSAHLLGACGKPFECFAELLLPALQRGIDLVIRRFQSVGRQHDRLALAFEPVRHAVDLGKKIF